MGGLAFPLESLPFLSMVSHHSPQLALFRADDSSGEGENPNAIKITRLSPFWISLTSATIAVEVPHLQRVKNSGKFDDRKKSMNKQYF